MKLSVLKQSYLTRRTNGFRDLAVLDYVFWLVLHGICCIISLILGFRFSRLVFFFLFSTSSINLTLNSFPFRTDTDITAADIDVRSAAFHRLDLSLNRTPVLASSTSRVVVGRHGIRIRPWPHPDPIEVMKAHQIIDKVQTEQRILFGVKNPRKLIAITPTYVRTFEALHLTGLMHSLMLVPYDLIWIVIEAGGVTNESATLIAKSGLRTIHVGFDQTMPTTWEGRHRLETKMRLHALRIVREQKLDGIVMFADDSNTHSMELFDEIQNVKWVGALSVGILVHSVLPGACTLSQKRGEEAKTMPVQGPACDSSSKLVGWLTFNTSLYAGKHAIHIDDRDPVLPPKLEWAGFVLNSRLLWKDADDKPEWMKDIDALADEDVESPLSLLKDTSIVEPLGSCGRMVLLWWLRVEAHTDCKFPPSWIIDPPLEITVRSKRTPWPDPSPEIASNENVFTRNNVQEQTDAVKEYTRTRASRTKHHRSKRRNEAKHAEQLSRIHSQKTEM